MVHGSQPCRSAHPVGETHVPAGGEWKSGGRAHGLHSRLDGVIVDRACSYLPHARQFKVMNQVKYWAVDAFHAQSHTKTCKCNPLYQKRLSLSILLTFSFSVFPDRRCIHLLSIHAAIFGVFPESQRIHLLSIPVASHRTRASNSGASQRQSSACSCGTRIIRILYPPFSCAMSTLMRNRNYHPFDRDSDRGGEPHQVSRFIPRLELNEAWRIPCRHTVI